MKFILIGLQIFYPIGNKEYVLEDNSRGKCIHWIKSLGPLDLGPVQVIFSWTKWYGVPKGHKDLL